jgi:tetratricopeptide (TPR) repeat protein
LCRQALVLCRQLGQRTAEAHTWDSLGCAEHQLGHYHRAVACYRQALGLCREVGDRFLEAALLTHRGDTHHASADPQGAKETWLEALRILDDLQHPDGDSVRAKLTGRQRSSVTAATA